MPIEIEVINSTPAGIHFSIRVLPGHYDPAEHQIIDELAKHLRIAAKHSPVKILSSIERISGGYQFHLPNLP